MEDKGLPDFRNKLIVVYLADAPRGCEDGVLMEYPNFEMRNGRLFLHGRISEMKGQEWMANTQTAVLWDSVIHYIEYKSAEDYQSSIAQYKPSLLERFKR